MSAYRINVNRDLFCAACLTQGRKLYPVIPVQPFSATYKNLTLTKKDKICWECKHFILKMVAFRFKAMKAKVCLKALLNGEATQLQTLSRLCISKGIFLDVTEPPEDPIKPEPPFIVNVKSEADPDYETDEVNEDEMMNYQVFYHTSTAANKTFDKAMDDEDRYVKVVWDQFRHDKDIEVEIESNKVYKVGSDEVKHEKVSHGTEQSSKVLDDSSLGPPKSGDSLPNTILMSLLNRKSTMSIGETEIRTFQTSHPKVTVEISSEPTEASTALKENLPKISLTRNNSEDNTSQITNDFTEEKLTEDEMRRWRKSKRDVEFYVNSAPVFRCERCVEPFSTRRAYLGHMKRHTSMYGDLACHICDLKFMTDASLAAHRDSHYRLLVCQHCGHKWDTPNSMRSHCSAEHGVPVTVWSCDVCLRDFTSYRKLLGHHGAHRFMPCTKCGQKVTRGNYQLHMLQHKHGSEKRYSCTECGYKCQYEYNLKKHMRTHSNEIDEEAYCAACNKQFRDMEQYNIHMKYGVKHVTADVLRYKCDECGQGFASKVPLQRHIESKHSDLRNYRCESCPATFKWRAARTRHRRVMHEGYVAPKDKMCDYCGMAFQTKQMLSQHMNTHTGARPYVCDLCGATFGHKSARYLHRRLKHKIQKKNVKKDS